MNYIDYLIIAFIFIGFIIGYKDGMVRKIIWLLGFVLAIVLSIQYADAGAEYLAPIFSDEYYLAEIFSGFVIFVIVVIITAVVKRIVQPFDKVNRFLNQLTGGITGAIQIVFFISGVLLFLNIFRLPSKTATEKSLFYATAYGIIPSALELIIGDKTRVTDFFEEFIQGSESPDSVYTE